MKTSRRRILEYVRTHRAVTSADLQAALRTTEANVRRHLSILVADGLVQVIGERPTGGKGRPRRIFGPAQATLGSHLELLAEALLDEAAALDADATAALFERLAGRIEAALNLMPGEVGEKTRLPGAATAGRGEGGARRLVSAVQRLNAAHYQARWEARPNAPWLILGHCPFGTLPARRPEICALDARLLERILGSPVRQVERLARDDLGAAYCLFHILPGSPPR